MGCSRARVAVAKFSSGSVKWKVLNWSKMFVDSSPQGVTVTGGINISPLMSLCWWVIPAKITPSTYLSSEIRAQAVKVLMKTLSWFPSNESSIIDILLVRNFWYQVLKRWPMWQCPKKPPKNGLPKVVPKIMKVSGSEKKEALHSYLSKLLEQITNVLLVFFNVISSRKWPWHCGLD